MSVNSFSYGSGSVSFVERLQAQSGTPVVFVHAFPLSSSMWAGQIAVLEDRFRLVALDLRGFGRSDPYDEPLTMSTYAADVLALLDRKGFGSAVLVGLSMGGYVALAFAREYQHRLAGLVLADTRAAADTDEVRKGRYQMITAAQKNGVSAIADKMIPKLLSSKAREWKPELVATVRGMIEATPSAAIVRALEAMATRPDSQDALPAIDVPVLVLAGTEDEVTPASEAQTMADAFPNARFEAIPDAGHLSNLEAPGEFNRLLGEFLDSLPSPRV